TGEYVKLPGYAGHPPYERVEFPPHSGKFQEAVDLGRIARNVGRTSRENCGACHFKGGGGDGVKHGDMDSSLAEPMRYLDVHMDAQGPDFSCSSCHVTDGHAVAGSRYAPTAADDKGVRIPGGKDGFRATCQSCHGGAPHDDGSARHDKINDHTDKLACQTCHIPEFARGGLPTKMEWDWSTAGKLDDEGKPFVSTDSAGWPAYMSKKGNFRWEQSVIPEYRWFNGRVDYVMLGDKIDPDGTTWINRFEGGPDDPNSRIWPVKIHRGKQPIDAVNNVLTVNHLYGDDDTAYWKNFDWLKAAGVGMAAADLPFSGEIGFASTMMVWPITHMVAPSQDALSCTQCHSDGGRLKDVEGVYLPGRDGNSAVEFIGKMMALLALLGVIAHGGLRYVRYRLSRS
ncbi:tetrathionate reductase family octaheme c-type cytochrome, partial [Pseudomonadota bacterium]